MAVFSFSKEIIRQRKTLEGRDWLGTVAEGQDHFRDIDRFVQGTKTSETVTFDIRGLKLFGYSYAKQTIRRVVLSGMRSEYAMRNFLLVAQDYEICAEIDKALDEEKLIMIGSTMLGKEFYSHHFVLGKVQPKMIELLDLVIEAREIMTSEIAKRLHITLQDASNWLKKMSDLRLITRGRPVDRSGHVYAYRRIEPE